MDTKPRVIGYTRISKDAEQLGLGVARQEKALRALAKARGWGRILILSDNDVSAYDGSERPGYADLLARLDAGLVDVVAAYSLERLTRSMVSSAPLLRAAERHGVTIALVNGGDVDCSTPAGRFFASTLAALAKMESDVISMRTKAKHVEVAARGGDPGGRRLFGYTRTGTKAAGDRAVVIVPAEAAAVRQAARDTIDGTASLAAIAARWNAAGLLTTAGNPWERSAVAHLLHRPALAGRRVHKGTVTDAEWPAILDADTFAALQAELQSEGRAKYARGSQRLLPGSGRYACARCGGRTKAYMKHEEARKNGSRPDPVRHYRCVACNASRRAADVDEAVAAIVVPALKDPEVRAVLAPAAAVDTSTAVAERDALLSDRRTITSMLGERLVDEATAREQLRVIRDRLDALEASIGAARPRGPLEPPGPDDVEAWWKGLTPGQQGEIVCALADVVIPTRTASPDVAAVVTWRAES